MAKYDKQSQAGAHASPAMSQQTAASAASSGAGNARAIDMQVARKKKRGPWFVVFVIALVVFIGAVAALGVIGYSYWSGQQSYNEITNNVEIQATDDALGSGINVDWDALWAINPDTVAWVYIPGTNINYPVVQGSDNEYYLTHDFEGETGFIAYRGCVFLEAENASDFSDRVSFMFGHHLNDDTMFSAIAGFDQPDVFNANRTVYLLTPEVNYRLRSFSIVHCAADDPIVETKFSDPDLYFAYVQDKIDRSEVSVTDIPSAQAIPQAFAFATCDNLWSDGRYILYCYVDGQSAGSKAAKSPNGLSVVDPDAAQAIDSGSESAVNGELSGSEEETEEGEETETGEEGQ